MKIKRIWAKNLHGYLNFDIYPNESLSILVGINGSGKTSALNIINWLTTPSIPNIATHVFREIGIEIVQSNHEISIRVEQSAKDLNIHCTRDGKNFSPINVRFNRSPKDLINNKNARDEAFESYHGLSPEKSEVELWGFLKTLPKPLVISLDRRITIRTTTSSLVDDFDPEYYRLTRRIHQPPADPIAQIESLARDRHSKYKFDLIRINDELKSNIIASSFSLQPNKTQIPSIKDINQLESKLLKQITSWHNNQAYTRSISAYFRWIRSITESITNNTAKESNIISNYLRGDMIRINALSDSFNKFEKDSVDVHRPIKTYLDVLNTLVSDSDKTLQFNEESSELAFKTSRDETPRSVELMSSGEKQVLILLTLIAFPPETITSFIIDEPEISLHPKWQHQLLPSVMQLINRNNQMIVASHSPELVGRFKEFCIGI